MYLYGRDNDARRRLDGYRPVNAAVHPRLNANGGRLELDAVKTRVRRRVFDPDA